jgi:SAM-dependent methyltransferase
MTILALSPEQWEAVRAFQAKEIESLATDDEFARRASLTSHYSRIGEWLSPGLKGRVLEAGCGPGRYVALLSKLGFSVVGIDPFPKFPTWKLIKSHCQVEFHDGVFSESLPFPDGSFDHVACMAALLYFRDPDRALAEFRRVLKPGGRLVMRSVNRRNLYRIVRGRHLDPAARNHYTMRELVGLLSDAGFIVHKSFSYGFYPPYLEAWWWYLVNGIISTDVQAAMSLLTPPPLRMSLTLFCTAPSSGASRDATSEQDVMATIRERAQASTASNVSLTGK